MLYLSIIKYKKCGMLSKTIENLKFCYLVPALSGYSRDAQRRGLLQETAKMTSKIFAT